MAAEEAAWCAGWKAPAWATRWAAPTGIELCGLAAAVAAPAVAGMREIKKKNTHLRLRTRVS